MPYERRCNSVGEKANVSVSQLELVVEEGVLNKGISQLVLVVTRIAIDERVAVCVPIWVLLLVIHIIR